MVRGHSLSLPPGEEGVRASDLGPSENEATKYPRTRDLKPAGELITIHVFLCFILFQKCVYKLTVTFPCLTAIDTPSRSPEKKI